MNRSVKNVHFVSALVAVTLAVVATISSAASLTVNASQRFQTMAGMGSNVNVNNWNGGQLKPALDTLVDQGGASLLRVVRDPMDWVAQESDIAPLHNLDTATLTRIYEAPKMQDIWNTIGYLNQKGLRGNQLILNFMGWTPPWMGGSGAYGSVSKINPGKEPAFATMVASLVYYGRRVRGLDFTLLAPMNEQDLDGKEGPLVQPAQYVTVLKAVIAELNLMGLADVRLVGPDTVQTIDSYVSAMMGDATVKGRVDHLSFHVYGQATSPRTSYSGEDYWLTESAQWCSTCDQNGTPTPSEWAFARETNDFFLDDVGNGLPAVLVWEAYDGFYYHHWSDSSWGLLSNKTVPLYTPRKRFYANAQLSAFIRPGTQRVTIDAPAGVKALAFYDSSKKQLAIVGHNTGGFSITLEGQLNNVPVALSSLALYQTNSGSKNLQREADVAVAAQAFTVTIPADTFFSLANFPPATRLQVTAISPVSGPVSGGTAVTITGTGFVAPASVSIGGVAATGVTLVSSTSLTAVTGAHAAGLADVAVTIPGGESATLTQGFSFSPAPSSLQVTAISPVSGPVSGGTAVTITGTGFVGPATVSIGGVAAPGVSVSSSTRLTAVTGAHATGLANVTVTIPGPQSATLAQGFFYAPPPVVASYFTVTPCRVADTRSAQAPVLGPGERRVFAATGRCAVPIGATAVTLNVTAVGPTAPGFVRVTPGNGLSETSTVNFVPGVTRASNTVVNLATDGTGTVAATNGSTGTTHLVVDVTGYFQ